MKAADDGLVLVISHDIPTPFIDRTGPFASYIDCSAFYTCIDSINEELKLAYRMTVNWHK